MYPAEAPEIRLDARRIRNVLLIILGAMFVAEGVIVVLDFIVGVDMPAPLVDRLDSDSERSLQTLFNTALLVMAGLVCGLSARVRVPHPRTWHLLTGVFLLLAIDEYTMVHEGVGRILRDTFDSSGLLYFAWIVPYAFACLVLFLLVLPWLRALPGQTRRGFLWAAALYGAAVFVLEALAGYYWSGNGGRSDLIVETFTGFEEGMEMLGLTLFIYHVLAYLGSLHPEVVLITEER